jgi:uncharacterized membrane protein (UPF0127 family)
MIAFAPIRATAACLGLLLIVLASTCGHAADKLATIELRIGTHKLVAETATNDESRMRGLMHRKKPMPENHGMMFVFTSAGFHSMWMQNTYIPLSVAFMDEGGVILNIAEMTPLTTDPHTAAGFARYALEMNQGWFATRGIRAGAKVEGLAGAPAPK